MSTRRLKRFGSRRGQALVFVTASLPVMFGIVGLVADVGWAYRRREACRMAAQSAVMAVVSAAGSTTPAVQNDTACPATLSATVPWQIGCQFAQQNGFTNGSNNQTVSIQIGSGATGIPVSGVSPTKYWVAATVSEKVPTLFSSVLGGRWFTVKSRATEGVYAPTGGGCVYVLDPSDPGSLSMSGTTTITSGCGIYVNSSAVGAVNMTGSGGITTTGGTTTNVVGTVTMTGNYVTPSANQGVVRGNPVDPFASGLPAPPATGSCQPTAQFTGSMAHTISPGTYCSLIKQTGSGTLTLSSGVYILQAGINVSGTSTLTTTGSVMLFVSGGNVDLEGSGGVTLPSFTSGTYQGISIWQPTTNNAAAVIEGSAAQNISGLIYMPMAALTYQGSSSTGTNTSIACYTLSMVGSSMINAAASTPWATGLSGSSLSGGYLVE